MDITIRYLDGDSQLAVLAFHKAKSLDARPGDMDEVEHQAYDACVRYLGEHPSLERVYAFTSFGTKGRAWYYSTSDTYMQPMFGSQDLSDRDQYVELHSSEAQLIAQAVRAIRPLLHQREESTAVVFCFFFSMVGFNIFAVRVRFKFFHV